MLLATENDSSKTLKFREKELTKEFERIQKTMKK